MGRVSSAGMDVDERRAAVARFRVDPPDWFLRLALDANLSLLEMLALWLHCMDVNRWEVAEELARNERAVGEAIARAQRKLILAQPLTLRRPNGEVELLRDRFLREAESVLECARNREAAAHGAPRTDLYDARGRRAASHARPVVAEDLVEEKLRKLGLVQ